MDLAISALALVTAVTAFVQYRRMRRILLTTIDLAEKSDKRAKEALLAAERASDLSADHHRMLSNRVHDLEQMIGQRDEGGDPLAPLFDRIPAQNPSSLVPKSPDYEPEGLSVWHRLRREAEDL
jgi:hypothetical protein